VVPQSNLQLKKFAGPCQKESTSTNIPACYPDGTCSGFLQITRVSCLFRLEVTNTGPNAYSGPVLVNEAIGSSAESLDSVAGFNGGPSCTPTPNQAGQYVCDLAPGGVNLAPNQVLNQFVRVKIDPHWIDPSTCAVGNMASIKVPPGNTAENGDPSDDFAADTAVVGKIDLGNGKVACDPPHLIIKKVANPQLCAKTAGGYQCSYAITVTSTGPDPFHGEIGVDETLPAGASLKVGASDWTCPGGGPVYHCTHAKVDLPVNDTLTLPVTVFVPDANVHPGACHVPNKANLALSAGPLQGTNYEASATAEIEAPACRSTTGTTTTPPGPRPDPHQGPVCEAGSTQLPSDACRRDGTFIASAPAARPSSAPSRSRPRRPSARRAGPSTRTDTCPTAGRRSALQRVTARRSSAPDHSLPRRPSARRAGPRIRADAFPTAGRRSA
jgi:hypothetical protein